MDIQRQAFEKEYNKHHPNDMATRLQNGNYSGWVKQASWEMWQQAQKVAVPEGFVLVPKLSANYLFNIVPELGFKHQDQKDTVLYHLNYMASEFKESAKKFVEEDHAKQKAMTEAQELSHD